MKLLEENERHYFVDEAGDLTLFNKKGEIIVGTEGCSKFFIVGVALLQNSHDVRKSLSQLKEKILTDSYLSEIKSLKKQLYVFMPKTIARKLEWKFINLSKI